jgi:hypothetical protein
VQPVSETAGPASGAPQPGDNARLIAIIEQWAADICWRGEGLAIHDGETREQASLSAAYYKALEVAEDVATKLWVIRVAESYWPGLTETGPDSTASLKPASARRAVSKPVQS